MWLFTLQTTRVTRSRFGRQPTHDAPSTSTAAKRKLPDNYNTDSEDEEAKETEVDFGPNLQYKVPLFLRKRPKTTPKSVLRAMGTVIGLPRPSVVHIGYVFDTFHLCTWYRKVSLRCSWLTSIKCNTWICWCILG